MFIELLLIINKNDADIFTMEAEERYTDSTLTMCRTVLLNSSQFGLGKSSVRHSVNSQ